ncbi:DUF5994 family protein [Streptomyces sp. NPDC002463]|uniref:DUF5994 family protein n=1 Tax=Streptomyces sp. NPDC002463 TaxID=3364645 RepID=UPI003686C329
MTSTTALTRPTRLALTPKTSMAGLLDGAWWPYSRDLATELPPLVEALEGRWGRITRITVNPAPWPVTSHKVSAGGHTVHAGWFTEQDRDKMILLSYSLGRCDLLVVPPETEPAAATRLMAAASTPGNLHTTETVMSRESRAPAVPFGAVNSGRHGYRRADENHHPRARFHRSGIR